MKAKSRFTEAISTLIKETQEGVLKWEAQVPTGDLAPEPGRRIETVFQTTRDTWTIRLYAYEVQIWPQEDLWYWDRRVALEVSEEGAASWWRFPDEVATWDLLDAVRFRESRVDQFIDKLVPK